jgi:hypothetical protein
MSGAFSLEGGRYIPAEGIRGPWGANELGGGIITGLLAHQVEQHIDGTLHPARVTFDLFRPVPNGPLEMSSRVVRDGRRIRVVDVSLVHDGIEVSRASALLIRRSEEPPGAVASPPSSALGNPDGIPSDRWPGQPPGTGAVENRSLRPTGGAEPAARWTRLTAPVVVGTPLTALVRTAAAAEAASPVSNRSPEGLYFKNADTTAYMHRLPVGEWICLEVVARGSAEGVSVSECAMHDEQGVFGRSLVACVATPRNEMIGARASESPAASDGTP